MSEFEQQVVGSLLMDPSLITDLDCLPEHFETALYREVYRVILGMSSNNQVVDVFTVADELEKRTGKEWTASVASIAKESFGLKNLSAYNDEIKQKFKRRQAIEIAEALIHNSRSLDDSAIDSAIVQLMALDQVNKKTTFTLKETLRACVDQLQRVMDGEGQVALSTGFQALDNYIGGFHDTDLIVVGARPAMGKTALMLNFILNSGEKCALFSTEQSALQIGNRLMCIQGGVAGSKLRSGNFDDDDWSGVNAAMAMLSDKQIFIDEESQPTIVDIQRQARRWKQQYDIKAVYVDYIQRINGTDNRAPKHERVEEVAKGLKSLAKELDLPVVTLAQVNRSVESRNNKRPTMGDLSDSSAIVMI